MLEKVLRWIGMGLFALTGVGTLYMLARMRLVSPASKGIIRNYWSQEYEELEPGIHCILNPFCEFVEEVSTQQQVKALPVFTVKSLDNVDAVVQADITFSIEKPLSFYQQVKDPQNAFTEQAKAAFSSAIQTLNFAHVTSAEINRLAQNAGYRDKYLNSNQKGESISSDGIGQTQLISDGASFFESLLNACTSWGIKITFFRILSIEAKHQSISHALELTAETEVRAKAQEKAAQSQAMTIKILAEAESEAQLIRANAASQTSAILSNKHNGMEVYSQETQVRVAQAIGSNKNLNLVVNSDMTGDFYRKNNAALTTFSRPRSLSASNNNTNTNLISKKSVGH